MNTASTLKVTLTAQDTVHGLLLERRAKTPHAEFLIFENQRFTYSQIADRAAELAGALRALGIGRGDRVALLLSNRPEYLYCWFGISMLGALEVPINTAHKGELLAYVLHQAGCRALVIEQAFWAPLSQILDQTPTLEHIIVLDGLPAAAAQRELISWERMPRAAGAPDPEISGTDPHAIIFTSGTTGPSKGAVMPQRFPLMVGEIVARATGYTERDVLYNALPFFHGNAQFLSTMPALLCGARVVLARRFSASQFWPDVRHYGCTEFNYIGGIISILMKAEPTPEDKQHPLRVMMGAGAPKELFRKFEQRFGLRLIEGYGMSEIGIPLMTDGENTPAGSCGRPHPGYDVRLVDDAGEDVAEDTPGELLVRPHGTGAMMLEYFGMPERTVEAWRDLWFHTGDYLKRDAEGFYWFIDRKKDALRRRGENISSWEVEKIINAHPAVLESAAIAVPADIGEDEVLVCVATRAGHTLMPDDLVTWCEARMAQFMVPRYLRFLAALPKTPTERVQKFELRRQGVTADTWDRCASTLQKAAS